MDRREAFERAIPLVPGRTALLVVDMQRAFLEPGEAMEVPPARDIVPRIGELIAIFRDKGLPVVFTRFTYSAERAAARRRAPPRAPARHPRSPRRRRAAVVIVPRGPGQCAASSPTSSPARASS